jgi:TonB-dependent receptor
MASGLIPAIALATTAAAQATAPAGDLATAGNPAPENNAPTDIVVSGFRSSLKSAMDAKRNDIRMSDGISSEDIGKFPAENITEAIQRIAGVQMSNINGRGSTISIRGLGAQYARTTINGQTFASADFKDGFRYDIIQTDLANAIQVYKSPTADMDTGGLSGTVNIDTIHPLDYKGPHLTLTAKGYDNLYRGAVTPKVGAAYINSFADDTIGVMVNVDYQKLMDRGDYVFINKWYHPAETAANAYIPKSFRYRRIDRNTQQLMASGALQWKPTDNLEALFQAEFSRDHTTYNTQQLVYSFSNASNITVNKIANGVANNISVANGTVDNNDQSERRDLQTQAYTATLNWKPDGWKIHAAAHYTVGTAHLYEWASILGMNLTGTSTLDISNPTNVSFSPAHSVTDGSFYNNKSAYNWYAFYDGAYHFQSSKEAALQLDTTKDIYNAPIKSLVFGVKYHHESFATQAYRHDRDADPSDTTTYPEINYIPDMTGVGSTLVTNFLGNSMSIPHSFLEVNAPVWQSTLDSHGINVPVTYDASNSWRVDRYIPAVYAMANLDTQLFGKKLRGNVGVRYEHTHQNVAANSVDGNGTFLGRTNTIQDYGNVLPSATFALDVTKHFVTRLALAKVLVRPLLNSDTVMATSITTGTTTGRPFVAVAGGDQTSSP